MNELRTVCFSVTSPPMQRLRIDRGGVYEICKKDRFVCIMIPILQVIQLSVKRAVMNCPQLGDFCFKVAFHGAQIHLNRTTNLTHTTLPLRRLDGSVFRECSLYCLRQMQTATAQTHPLKKPASQISG